MLIKNNQNIPEGWSVKKISDVGTTVSGGTPDTNNPEYWDGDVLWVTPSEVSVLQNRFILNTERRITERGLKQSSAKLLPVNSLIICTRATIGDCCINKKPMCTNQGFKNIIVKDNNVDFLYYLVTKNKHELIRKACGSTFLEISKKDIDNLKFAIPPLPEQEKIALVLGAWDEAIEKLSGLIEQKKLLKKGLMQKLLTGKNHLSGFSQPWQKVKLGTLLESKSKRNKDLKISRVLSVTNSRGFILPEEQFARVVASEDLSNYKVVENGQYAYNPSRLNVGSIDRLDNFENGVLSPMYVIFQCNEKLCSDYFKHWITTAEFSTKVRNSAQGSVRETVDFKTLSTIKFYIPTDISEQQAIADVLSTADDEINLLNQKLEALKTQKKGLMQKLLTGQIRVKVRKNDTEPYSSEF